MKSFVTWTELERKLAQELGGGGEFGERAVVLRNFQRLAKFSQERDSRNALRVHPSAFGDLEHCRGYLGSLDESAKLVQKQIKSGPSA